MTIMHLFGAMVVLLLMILYKVYKTHKIVSDNKKKKTSKLEQELFDKKKELKHVHKCNTEHFNSYTTARNAELMYLGNVRELQKKLDFQELEIAALKGKLKTTCVNATAHYGTYIFKTKRMDSEW